MRILSVEGIQRHDLSSMTADTIHGIRSRINHQGCLTLTGAAIITIGIQVVVVSAASQLGRAW